MLIQKTSHLEQVRVLIKIEDVKEQDKSVNIDSEDKSHLEQVRVPIEIEDVEELDESVHVNPEDAVVELRRMRRVKVQRRL